MCGIAGVFLPSSGPTADIARAAADSLVHRGPDDSGVWSDDAAGIGLGHRRLSIVDLSPAGHQPMFSASGRYVIVFNGEIYNHADLRAEVEGQGNVFAWRGHSDTESLLAGFEAWGIEATLRKAVGMFAFAVWDRADAVLTLARDRLGEKPLYFGVLKGALLFGSELKALRACPGFDPPVDRRALALYMRHNYIPAPWTIYEGVRKLAPGSLAEFRRSGDGVSETRQGTYWSARQAAEGGLSNPFRGDEREAVEELERVLSRSIAGQMIADVPLGAFLSGGIDSATVVALMQAQSNRPVKTFTIGFNEKEYNEAAHAMNVARHLGCEHTELYVTPEQAMAVIPRLPTMYDEPFADSSQVPTHLVSALARRHVTVSLSGDAGDELLGGYNRYFWAVKVWRKLARVPSPLRGSVARLVFSLPPTRWNQLFAAARPVLPQRLKYGNAGDKLHKLASLLNSPSLEAIYLRLLSHWDEPASVVIGGDEPATPITDSSAWIRCPDFEHRMMFLDTVTYLPDDILVKVDRAAMAVSLETRVPMLDHRVVEFAWSLPLHMKVRNGEGKWALRQVLYRHVPRELIERPKMGFGVPIDHWLRGPLREWAEDLLDEGRLRREGFFQATAIREKWAEHLSGRRNWQYHLWDVLMFQGWLASVR